MNKKGLKFREYYCNSRMETVCDNPKYTFNKWNSSEKFIAGQTYMGMPYTMFAGGYTYDAWKNCSNYDIYVCIIQQNI